MDQMVGGCCRVQRTTSWHQPPTFPALFELHKFVPVILQRWSLGGTHHKSDGSLLVNVDGDVGALDPGVGAQMSQSHIRVSAREKNAAIKWKHTYSIFCLCGLQSCNQLGCSLLFSEVSSVFLPRHEWVCFLQRSGVQLEQRSNIVPMSHCNQLVLDVLSVRTLVAAAAVQLQMRSGGEWERAH